MQGSLSMSQSEISIKQHGVTIEIQIDDYVCYINPFEQSDDRNPENADVIMSFVRGGVNELHMKSDLSALMSGIVRYGMTKSNYLVCDTIQSHWRGLDIANDPVFADVPSKSSIRGLDANMLELGEHMIGTELLMHEEKPFGLGVTIDDTEIHYLYADSNCSEAFLEQTANCAILVAEDWKKAQNLFRKIINADHYEHYYLACSNLRKNELKEFKEVILPRSVAKLVLKKSKWILGS
jgi:hypothetical protein